MISTKESNVIITKDFVILSIDFILIHMHDTH
jgi:hypothetical protein